MIIMKKPSFNLAFRPVDGLLTRVTGIFANPGKNYYSVKVTEDIVIPAGSYMYMFEEDGGPTDEDSN
jgi:hypothetical protein